MLKSYDELVKVDVAPYCEERVFYTLIGRDVSTF